MTSAADFVALAEATGYTVRERSGVFWVRRGQLFWRPLDYLAPLSEAGGPFGAGFHHVLAGTSERFLPMTVIEHVAEYTLQKMSARARRDVMTGQRRADITTLTEPELLLEQGMPIWQEAAVRSGQRIPPTHDAFRKLIQVRYQTPSQFVVSASRDGRLGAFLTGHVIGDRCSFDEVVISNEARRWRAGAALYDLGLEQARRLGARVAFLGLWMPEVPTLEDFELRMGAVNRLYPAASHLAWPLVRALRRLRPLTYARLTGRLDTAACADLAPARPQRTLPAPAVES